MNLKLRKVSTPIARGFSWTDLQGYDVLSEDGQRLGTVVSSLTSGTKPFWRALDADGNYLSGGYDARWRAISALADKLRGSV